MTNVKAYIIINEMANEKGLTGIREFARGFVGSKPAPVFDQTKAGRKRVKFIIACGMTNENMGKFPTWRFCVGYDDIATKYLAGLKVGDLVHVHGWLSTEWLTDEYYKPVRDERENIVKREYLIVFKAEIKQHEKSKPLQPELVAVS